MIDFNFNDNCSGCGVCANVCPVQAIRMRENKEGFLMPYVDRLKCTDCGLCDGVCPHINVDRIKGVSGAEMRAVWLYSSKDDKAKLRSSSGAACYELERATIVRGGIIAGCVWDEKLRAIHVVGSDAEILEKTQGSKYVQSLVGNCYKDVIRQIQDGRQVVFTGTPCQATAMHNLAMQYKQGKYRDNLITLAVICHGVASPRAWESYKQWAGDRMGSPLVNVNFRDKTRKGYKKSYCRYEYQSGAVTYFPTYLPSSKYIEATLVYNLGMRNSCSRCDCKGINTGIDIIVGDWYAEYKGEGEMGTSCIIAFTERGEKYAKSNLKGLRPFSYEKILAGNPFLENSIRLPANRSRFLEEIGDYRYWNQVEELYPSKYKFKKFLVKVGLYRPLKKIFKVLAD